MKKIIISMIIGFISIFVLSNGVEAACYKKCSSDDCGYYRTCEASDSITCKSVSETKCGLISCGNMKGIPKKIPEITSYIITVIQVAIPIILVIMGSIDLFKGVTAQKEDEIKKGQMMFVKRLIIAAIIFFVVMIVKFFISIVADTDNTKNIVDCIECFVNGDC